MMDWRWMQRAACRDIEDPSIFWDYSTNRLSAEIHELCDSCPVRSQCYMHALRHEDYGAWAGTTERERRRLRKAAGIKLEKPEGPIVDHKGGGGHGTEAGFARHRRADEDPCDACKQAQSDAVQIRKERARCRS